MTRAGQPAAADAGARRDDWRFIALRFALVLAALALAAGAAALIALAFSHGAPAPQPRNPFAAGVAESSAGGRFGAVIAALQSTFYRALTDGLHGLRTGSAGLWALVGVGFAYGVFHAAGPGHGKAVISGYLVASEQTLARGVGLSFAAALVQALVAIGIALVLGLAFRATAATTKTAAGIIELLSFALVLALGLMLVWRKAGGLASLLRPAQGGALATGCGDDCGHAHMPDAATVARAGNWRAMAGVVVAAGARPCSGALIVLAFALSQGVLYAGVAATFAMALGTAITTSLVAALAVFAKRLALRLAASGGAGGAVLMAALELLAAACICLVGAALLAGLWRYGWMSGAS